MRSILLLSIIFIALGVSCNRKVDGPNSSFEFSSEGKGCCSFIVYKTNSNNDFLISVSGHRESLKLSVEQQIFDLSNTSSNDLSVEIHKLDAEALNSYCDRMMFSSSGSIIDSWIGKSGTVKIKIVEDVEKVSESKNTSYKIEVILENVSLKNNKGGKIFIEYLEFNDIEVGNCPS